MKTNTMIKLYIHNTDIVQFPRQIVVLLLFK